MEQLSALLKDTVQGEIVGQVKGIVEGVLDGFQEQISKDETTNRELLGENNNSGNVLKFSSAKLTRRSNTVAVTVYAFLGLKSTPLKALTTSS